MTDDGGSLTYTAGVYWPDNSRGGGAKEADAAARQLLEDIDFIPHLAHIIILGDLNFDPFENRGSNGAAMRLLLTCKRLRLVERPGPTCFICFPPPPRNECRTSTILWYPPPCSTLFAPL